jgi:ADP-ribose pyrophosphatase YjhB (NUDIX family)
MTLQSYEDSYLGQLRSLIGKEKIIINAARAVIFDRQGRLLLIRRRDNKRWAMPAGAMELGESIYECLVREVREESGLDVQAATLFAIWSDPIKTSIVTHYGDPYQVIVFVFRVDKWRGELVSQTDETVDAGFFTLDGLPAIAPHYQETLEDLKIFEIKGRFILK